MHIFLYVIDEFSIALVYSSSSWKTNSVNRFLLRKKQEPISCFLGIGVQLYVGHWLWRKDYDELLLLLLVCGDKSCRVVVAAAAVFSTPTTMSFHCSLVVVFLTLRPEMSLCCSISMNGSMYNNGLHYSSIRHAQCYAQINSQWGWDNLTH